MIVHQALQMKIIRKMVGLFAKWKLNVWKKHLLLFDRIIRKNIKYFNSYITPDHTYTLTHLTFYNFALNIETREYRKKIFLYLCNIG